MNKKLYNKFNQLEDLKNQVLKMIESIKKENLYAKSTEEKWSVVQILNHILESETGTTKYIRKKLKTPDALKAINFKSKLKGSLLMLALKSSFKFKAPKVLGEPSNETPIEELLEKWNNTRTFLKQTIQNFPEELLEKQIFKHPKSGHMNIFQTLDFLNNHLNHHIVQIKKLLRE